MLVVQVRIKLLHQVFLELHNLGYDVESLAANRAFRLMEKSRRRVEHAQICFRHGVMISRRRGLLFEISLYHSLIPESQRRTAVS
jgi:hypothetical protein